MLGRRGARRIQQRIEGRRVIPRVVERPATLAGIEHCREMAESEIAGNARKHHIEAPLGIAHGGEEGGEFHHADVQGNSAGSEVGLYELLDGHVATADREQREFERPAVSAARALGASAAPPGGVEQAVGRLRLLTGIRGGRRSRRHGKPSGNGARRGRAETGDGGIDELLPLDRQRYGPSNAPVVEGGARGVEREHGREERGR